MGRVVLSELSLGRVVCNSLTLISETRPSPKKKCAVARVIPTHRKCFFRDIFYFIVGQLFSLYNLALSLS